jgi:putative nucleotidyltransferase with HDIG domain
LWPDSLEARTAIQQAVTSLDAMLEKSDRQTVGHQRRVAQLARAIAVEMGLSEEQVQATQTAALVHDVGKVCVPAEILSRPGKLSEVEFAIIKVHPRAGYDILKGIQFPGPVAHIVLQHHERLDGSGYLSGLSGKDILHLQELVRRIPAADHMIEYAKTLARLTRPSERESPQFIRDWLTWGAGPRAGLYMIWGAKARAALYGRNYVSADDIAAVAHPVLRHRLITNFVAQADGIDTDTIVDRLLEMVPKYEKMPA